MFQRFRQVRYLYLLLALVIIGGFIFRFYNLGLTPVSVDKDEAFLGYNAYSLLKTGKDMTGVTYPSHLSSFLYTPAGYSYLSLPFIALFDLSAFSVRFASALFGSITVIVCFFLAREIFSFSKTFHLSILSLLVPFFLAISPWHINLSRTASTITPVVFFISLGVLLYLYWLRRGSFWLLLLSFISFFLSMTLYVAPYSFLPLLIPVMAAVFYKEVKNKKSLLVVGLLYSLCIVIPLCITLFSADLSIRARSLSIFHHTGVQLVLDEHLREDGVAQTNRFETRVFHNKLVSYSTFFLDNYFRHFSYPFLFSDQGLPLRYKIPYQGLLYLFELPLIILGGIYLFKKHRRIALFFTIWILLVPIGSSLTIDDVPNLQRTLFIFPALSLFISAGAIQVVSFFRPLSLKLLFTGILALCIAYSVLFYLHQYYIHQLYHQPWHRQEGYQELVMTVNELLPNYEKVVVTNWESVPSIFFLFYGKYDPAHYQQLTQGEFTEEYKNIGFDKYEPTAEECPLQEKVRLDPVTKAQSKVIEGREGVLYINHGPCETPTNHVKTVKEIKRLDGTTVFRVLTYQHDT